MRFTDPNFISRLEQGIGTTLFILLFLINGNIAQSLFRSGKEYVYSYNATSNTGVLVPSNAASSWNLNGELVIQAEDYFVTIQLRLLKTRMWNGNVKEPSENIDIYDNAVELLKPFRVSYNKGLIENFSIETEEIWATNIKRSIAGILQLDLPKLEKEVAFHSSEINHYGKCNIDYVVSPEGDTQRLVRKSLDPRMCTRHPSRNWSNVPKIQCTDEDQNPVLKGSERIYKLKTDGHIHDILSVNTFGNIYVQPFQSMGQAHYHFVQQTIELSSMKDITNKIVTNNLQTTVLLHELPEADLTQGRSTPDKHFIFKSISRLLDRLSQRLENPGLDTEIHNLHNTTISVLLYYLDMLDRVDLGKAYNRISGTSYKEETIRNMFLEALPQVGSRESALFILDLIRENKVSDVSAIQLLMRLPFHLRRPDAELLANLQPLLTLPSKISAEVRNTAILTFGTLIYKSCFVSCPYDILDYYVRLYLDKFTESTQHEQKMVWLQGLANIQLGKVVEFLEPIASGNNPELRHFRALAAWASVSTAPLRPDVIYPVYWPILVNRTEDLEMRIAALTLLIISNPTPNRLISLYWYMQNEPNQHLYNYFYTTLKSMERTTDPCYKRISRIAAQFSRILRKPSNGELLITGNYLVDYQDSARRFGAMLHGIIVANPFTNIPEVIYVTLNNYASGTQINQLSLYIKAKGVFHSLATISFDNPTNIKDILTQFKFDERKKDSAHLEIIARIQEKTVLCVHWNETKIVEGLKYLSSLLNDFYYLYYNMEFHVNQQRINVPLTIESIQATDLGTNVRLAMTATSLFSMRGNFTRDFPKRNNHVILRTSVHGIEIIENYNPLVDLWHSAERVQSLHGYLPFNITIELKERPYISYDTLGEHIKTGITAHVKTVTSIRGANVKSKLERACRSCPASYTVVKSPSSNLQTMNILNVELPELGGRLKAKIFDCETMHETLINDILSSHQSNYQTWPSMKFVLLGLHVLDYLTYMPPSGSCGLATYIEAVKSTPSQTKLDYTLTEDRHILSLTHQDLQSSQILHQWYFAVLYESTGWLSDVLKLKMHKIVPGAPIFKLCAEVERHVPWQWEFLSNEPSDLSRIKLNIVWGLSDSAKGKCSGSSISMNLIGEISSKQIEESKEASWSYGECKKESTGKTFIPYTRSCYEASRELSTLRKYTILARYENLPESLSKLVWKMYAFYDLIGGNSTNARKSDEIAITALFPKESNVGELQLNRDKVAIEYNSRYIEPFLTRTRIHNYMEMLLVKMFSSTCVITLDSIKSAYNVDYTFAKNNEVILLGQCYDENPRLALTAANGMHGINVNLTDESETTQIVAGMDRGALYNATSSIKLQSDHVFHKVGSKMIKTSDKTIDILLPNILLFIHWTREQILLFFPNHVLDFSCGICTLDHSNVDGLYEKLI